MGQQGKMEANTDCRVGRVGFHTHAKPASIYDIRHAIQTIKKNSVILCCFFNQR